VDEYEAAALIQTTENNPKVLGIYRPMSQLLKWSFVLFFIGKNKGERKNSFH
jgi:hypothetical protein